MSEYQLLLQQGAIFLSQEQYGEAARVFGEAVQLNPERKEALTQLGILCKDMGDLDGAIGFLVRAAQLDDGDAFVRLNLGLALYEKARYEEAAFVLEKTVAMIDQGVGEMRALLDEATPAQRAAIVQQCAELEETATEIRALLAHIDASQRTPSYETLLEQAHTLLAREETAEAVSLLQQAVKIQPDEKRAYVKLVQLYLQHNAAEAAVACARQALALDEKDFTLRLQLGQALWLCGDRAAARAQVEQALQDLDRHYGKLQDAYPGADPASHPSLRKLIDLRAIAQQFQHELQLRAYFSTAASNDTALPHAPPVPGVQGRRLRIGILTCLWKRHALSDAVLAHYHTLQTQVASWMDLELFAVGSEGEITRTLATRHSFHYVEHPNSPLGAKWNAGLKRMQEASLDAVLIVGSDDLIGESLLRIWHASLQAGYAFMGLTDLYMLDLATLRLCYWPGYTQSRGRQGEPIGLGRCIRTDLLDAVGWQLWEDSLNGNLDGSMVHILAPPLVAQHDRFKIRSVRAESCGVLALDVKSGENIWAFDDLAGELDVRYLPPLTFLREHLPDEVLHRLLALSPEASQLAALMGKQIETPSPQIIAAA